ncbi:hypothetical protein NXS19_012592 [Fusarium pseudograminearum]|nr:hypothetical protein NXS19_012592 [Fusarium pseudograminearum]
MRACTAWAMAVLPGPRRLTSGGSNAELGIAGHTARGAIQGHAGGVHPGLKRKMIKFIHRRDGLSSQDWGFSMLLLTSLDV